MALSALTGCGSERTAIADAQGTPDSAELTLGLSDCGGDHEAEVEATDATVTITVVTRRRLQLGSARHACMDLLVLELDEPLGNRDVVDGTTGEVIEVQP